MSRFSPAGAGRWLGLGRPGAVCPARSPCVRPTPPLKAVSPHGPRQVGGWSPLLSIRPACSVHPRSLPTAESRAGRQDFSNSLFYSLIQTSLQMWEAPFFLFSGFKTGIRGFLAGSVVRIPPANAGDVSSTPGWETRIPSTLGKLNLPAATREKPARCSEAPTRRNSGPMQPNE